MERVEFEIPVDDQNKATEFNPFKGGIHCGKRLKTNPHMRAFWAATLAFTFAFIGWFAFAPLLVYVQKDIEGAKCDCGKGTQCKLTISNANVCAVSFDILTRFLLGSVIEAFGPKNTDCMLLFWGVVVVGCSALVQNGPGLITVRFFVSALGSTFVVNQFWNSIMFNKKVVGTANATAGGWGNLGGGLTQV